MTSLLRIKIVNAIDAIVNGDDISDDDINQMIATIERADELVPLENIEPLVETPTSNETADLARLLGVIPKKASGDLCLSGCNNSTFPQLNVLRSSRGFHLHAE